MFSSMSLRCIAPPRPSSVSLVIKHSHRTGSNKQRTLKKRSDNFNFAIQQRSGQHLTFPSGLNRAGPRVGRSWYYKSKIKKPFLHQHLLKIHPLLQSKILQFFLGRKIDFPGHGGATQNAGGDVGFQLSGKQSFVPLSAAVPDFRATGRVAHGHVIDSKTRGNALRYRIC